MTYARRTPSPSAVSSYRPRRLEHGFPLGLRQLREVAAREDEVEEALAVEHLLECRIPPSRPGRRACSRRAPGTTSDSSMVSLPMIALSRAIHGSLVVARVPDERDATARAQYAGDLGQRVVVVEPVERLGGDDDVGRRVGKRDRLGAPLDRMDARAAPTSSSARISSSGSTAVTRWPRATSARVSLPVPAPRSTTSHGPSPTSQRTASSG